jgi:hypothetical protein
MAFATAYVYARQLRSRAPESVAYEPILQFRNLAGDIVLPGGAGVYHQGVVFVGPRSALWEIEAPTHDQIRAELEREPLAVPHFYSEAGYLYPQLELHNRFPGIRPRGPVFCRTGAGVIKHVISGLLAVGACDGRLLEAMLGPIDPPPGEPRLYRELIRTTRIPTDPVLLRSQLHPRRGEDGLGIELKLLTQRQFNEPPEAIPGLAL